MSAKKSGAGPDHGVGRPLRVVITTTALLNGGDAALLLAQLQLLRHEFGHIEVVIFDQQAEVAARYYPNLDPQPSLALSAVSPRTLKAKVIWAGRVVRLLGAAVALRHGRTRLARRVLPSSVDLTLLRQYFEADVVFTNGGTMLVEAYDYLPRLVEYTIVILVGRPLIFFTQSMGPFRAGFRSRWLAAIFRRSELILVRGAESERHALDLVGSSTLVRVAPDPVFFAVDPARIRRPRAVTEGGLRVAISCRRWPFFQTVRADVGQAAYEAAMAQLCCNLVRHRRARITFISTCQGVPEYWSDDALPAATIIDLLPEDVRSSVSLDAAFHRPADLCDILADCDIAISTRLHLGILAMTVGTPTLPIAYESKTIEVFTALGLEQWIVDIETVNAASLTAKAFRMADSLEGLRRALPESVLTQRDGAYAVGTVIRSALGVDGRSTVERRARR